MPIISQAQVWSFSQCPVAALINSLSVLEENRLPQDIAMEGRVRLIAAGSIDGLGTRAFHFLSIFFP